MGLGRNKGGGEGDITFLTMKDCGWPAESREENEESKWEGS